MKRSPLKRRKRLERARRKDAGLPPRPRPRRPRKTPEELAEIRRVIYGGPTGDHDAFVRSRGCLLSLSECAGPVEAHHDPLVSQGGIWSDQVPLCRAHHTGWSGGDGNGLAFPLHQGVKTFARRYHWVDLQEIAAAMVQKHYPEGVPDAR